MWRFVPTKTKRRSLHTWNLNTNKRIEGRSKKQCREDNLDQIRSIKKDFYNDNEDKILAKRNNFIKVITIKEQNKENNFVKVMKIKY